MRPKWSCLAIMYTHAHVGKKQKQNKHSILVLNTTCQHSGGQLMICACFAAMRPGHLSLFGVQRSSWLAQSILEAILRPSNWQQKLGPNWVMQKDNESNTPVNLPNKKWLKKKRIKVLQVQTSAQLKCCRRTLRVALLATEKLYILTTHMSL